MKTLILRTTRISILLFTMLSPPILSYCQNSQPDNISAIERMLHQKTVVSIEKSIPEFENIAVDQNFNIYIFEGTGNKMIIETEEKILQDIFTEVVDGTLNITCAHKIQNPKALNIFVTTTRLNRITLSGINKIKIYPRVTSNIELYLTNEQSSVQLYLSDMKFKCTIKGYGSVFAEGIFKELVFCTFDETKLKLDVNTSLLKCYSNDKSYVNISGITNLLNLFAQDESGINSFNMFANKCSVNVKDASEVSVNKSDELFIAGENKSNIEYKGESVVIVKALDAIKIRKIKEKKFITIK